MFTNTITLNVVNRMKEDKGRVRKSVTEREKVAIHSKPTSIFIWKTFKGLVYGLLRHPMKIFHYSACACQTNIKRK